MGENHYLTRQPVLNVDWHLLGFSIGVQGDGGVGADQPDPRLAGARTLLTAINSPGFARMVGQRRIFADLPREFLYQELDSFLNGAGSTLMLPQPDAEPGLEEAVRARRAESFQVGFEVSGPGVDSELLGRTADVLRFELDRFPEPSTLTATVSPFRSGGAAWLANGVHTQEAFQRCRVLGFSMFQGSFFTKPTTFTSDVLSPRQLALIELFRKLSSEADFAEVEATFKKHPDLAAHLLELLNSAAFRRQKPIHSLRQALVGLGMRNLRRWVALLLLTDEDGAEAQAALLDEALIRARTMELAAERIQPADWFAGSAFLTAILSVLEPVLKRPVEQLVEDLNLDQPIADALAERKGQLGELLATVEQLRDRRELPGEVIIGETRFRSGDWFGYEEQAAFDNALAN
ncbi:EAL and HDOD domain-containing protein [Thiohalorhabdus sp.]|uniref:EAL and HDOD domain-containing protein n=1 Tax=Thiohalorhabdus sp. TaxID=3094134 RepID=UPI002FC32FF2